MANMKGADDYITLLSSLPQYNALFDNQVVPISRYKLDQRLHMLQEADYAQLKQIESVFNWDAWPVDSEHGVILDKMAALLASIDDDKIRQLLQDKIDLRSVVGALRQRHQQQLNQQPLQPPTGHWTLSRYRSRIEKNWQEDDFRLGTMFPWLQETAALIRAQKTYAAEKLILQHSWQTFLRHQPESEFSFMAVIVYVMKWNIVDRLSRYEPEQARTRFQALVRSALA